MADVFDARGTFIHQVSLYGGRLGYQPIFSADGSIWVVTQDEDEESVVIKYHLRK